MKCTGLLLAYDWCHHHSPSLLLLVSLSLMASISVCVCLWTHVSEHVPVQLRLFLVSIYFCSRFRAKRCWNQNTRAVSVKILLFHGAFFFFFYQILGLTGSKTWNISPDLEWIDGDEIVLTAKGWDGKFWNVFIATEVQEYEYEHTYISPRLQRLFWSDHLNHQISLKRGDDVTSSTDKQCLKVEFYLEMERHWEVVATARASHKYKHSLTCAIPTLQHN